jgi:hypothetical protein
VQYMGAIHWVGRGSLHSVGYMLTSEVAPGEIVAGQMEGVRSIRCRMKIVTDGI